jgi:hypothetical protein
MTQLDYTFERQIELEREASREEGREEGTHQTLFGLVKDGLLTVTEAARRADMSEVSFRESMDKFMA